MTRQAKIIDIHEFYRIGGIDWAWCKDNLDALGIRCARGLDLDELFFYHVEKCVEYDIVYFTYQVPNPRIPAAENADFYIEIDGVEGHVVVGDNEPLYGLLGSGYFYKTYFERLTSRSGPDFPPWYYSNYNYSQKIGLPNWSKNMFVWWAEYPTDIIGPYKKFDRYLQKNPWKTPKWAVRGGYTPELHQFTKKLDARFYLANDTTDDPRWPDGIKSADGNVSLIDADEILSILNPGDPGQTIEERISALEIQVKDHENRLQDLEGL